MWFEYKRSRRDFVEYVDKRVLKGGLRLWDSIAYNPMLFLEICRDYKEEEGK